MSDNKKGTMLVVPAFKNCKELRIDTSGWEVAKSRMTEVQHLVPANYSSLEFTFQEAWRESRRNAIMTEDAIKKTLQSIEEIKADIILTEIPRLLNDMPKNANNTDFRKAVITKNEDYRQASEHLEKLQSILAHLESNMKVMENTSRFLKKQMDYIIRSGSVGPR
jgi:predicted nuclease with TOPRIM domain